MPVNLITEDDFTPRTFAEAAERFARKLPLPSFLFERLSAAARQRAFRIANVHKLHLVQQARDAIQKAIDKGTGWADVRRDLIAKFAASDEAPPPLFRLRQMFHQNIHQAYSDQRREVLDDPNITEAFPFRQYLTVGNGVPGVRGVRPEHAALHGLVFAWDDPFWDAHTPPWDWGCRCTFVALTENQVRSMGVRVRNLRYVRKSLPVPGISQKGIDAGNYLPGNFDPASVDEELRQVARELVGVMKTMKPKRQVVCTATIGVFEMPSVVELPTTPETGLIDVLLAHDGLNDYRAGRFTIDHESAEMILAELKMRGTDPVVDYEHQTLGGEYSAPSGLAPAAGWMREVRYEKGRGLIARVEWTDRARQMIRAKEYRYISPVLIIRKNDTRAVELRNAALTNQPAIRGMEAVAAKDPARREGFREEQPMNSGLTATGQERLARIAKAVSVELGSPADIEKSLELIETAVMKAKPQASPATYVRIAKELGLSENATEDAICTAITSYKSSITAVAAKDQKIVELTADVADLKLASRLKPYIDKGVLDPKDAEFYPLICRIASQKWEDAERILNDRVAMLPPQGRTTPPAGDAPASREAVIAKAKREYMEGGTTGRVTDLAAFVNATLIDKKLPALKNEERELLVA